MNENQKNYTEAFRDQAVDLLISSGRALKQVAVELYYCQYATILA